MLIVYDYDSNMILAEPMKSRSGAEYLAAYQKIHSLLTSRGLKPQMQNLDNEASTALQQFMHEEAIDYQLAPPHVHRTNAAERAICTFKNHFIAGLNSTDLSPSSLGPSPSASPSHPQFAPRLTYQPPDISTGTGSQCL